MLGPYAANGLSKVLFFENTEDVEAILLYSVLKI